LPSVAGEKIDTNPLLMPSAMVFSLLGMAHRAGERRRRLNRHSLLKFLNDYVCET
jgi:hypothetical protein